MLWNFIALMNYTRSKFFEPSLLAVKNRTMTNTGRIHVDLCCHAIYELILYIFALCAEEFDFETSKKLTNSFLNRPYHAQM
jgi:hypothetical protein